MLKQNEPTQEKILREFPESCLFLSVSTALFRLFFLSFFFLAGDLPDLWEFAIALGIACGNTIV